ncbi:MAG TPA: hypothetical protein PKH33_17130 [bacterium]|nr:hypothetical protein [bacterium]
MRMTEQMAKILNKDYKVAEKQMTSRELNAILARFNKFITGSVRMKNQKVATRDSLEKRRQKVSILP